MFMNCFCGTSELSKTLNLDENPLYNDYSSVKNLMALNTESEEVSKPLKEKRVPTLIVNVQNTN